MRKFLSLTLTAAMVTGLLGACAMPAAAPQAEAEPAAAAVEEAAAPKETATPAEEAAAAEETATAEEAPAEEAAGEALDFDGVELKLVLFAENTVEGWPEIEEKINEITSRELNLTIKADWIDIGNWSQQMNLRLAGNDEIDIMALTPLLRFTNLQASNQLLDITDYMEEFGQDILATAGDYVEGDRVNGRIYGIPNYFSKGAAVYIQMNTDVLNELGLLEAAQNMKTWSDYEAILTEVRDNTNLVPLVTGGQNGFGITTPGSLDVTSENFADAHALTGLGDPYSLLQIDPETNEVYCYYLTDKFDIDCARAADFFEKGLMYKDGETNGEPLYTFVKDGKAFSLISATETLFAEEHLEQQAGGVDFTIYELATNPVARGSLNLWGYALPYSCAYPEASVAFLNLLFKSPELENYFIWGLEGRDYEVNPNGSAQRLESATYKSDGFLWPNRLIAHSNVVTTDNASELEKEAIANQVYNKYLGFVCDFEPLNNDLTACSNVKSEFVPGLICGSSANWEERLAAFRKKLTDNGINDIIANCQEQLDAWLAEQ